MIFKLLVHDKYYQHDMRFHQNEAKASFNNFIIEVYESKKVFLSTLSNEVHSIIERWLLINFISLPIFF